MSEKNVTIKDLQKKGWKKVLTFPHEYALLAKGNNSVLFDVSIKKIVTELGPEKSSMQGKSSLKELEEKGWEKIYPFPHEYELFEKNSKSLLLDVSTSKIVASWTE